MFIHKRRLLCLSITSLISWGKSGGLTFNVKIMQKLWQMVHFILFVISRTVCAQLSTFSNSWPCPNPLWKVFLPLKIWWHREKTGSSYAAFKLNLVFSFFFFFVAIEKHRPFWWEGNYFTQYISVLLDLKWYQENVFKATTITFYSAFLFLPSFSSPLCMWPLGTHREWGKVGCAKGLWSIRLAAFSGLLFPLY